MKKLTITLAAFFLSVLLVGCTTTILDNTPTSKTEEKPVESLVPQEAESKPTPSVAQQSPESKPKESKEPQQSEVPEATESKKDNAPSANSSRNNQTASQQTQSQQLTKEKAKKIALDHAGVKESQIKGLEIEYDKDDGTPSYEIEFRVGTDEYEYDIHRQTGEILKAERNDVNILTLSNQEIITKQKAKEIALKQAGVSEQEIRDYQIEMDHQGTQKVYEIEFEKGLNEYELTMNAHTGSILHYQKDKE